MGRPCWRIFPTFTWAKEIYMFSTFANLIFPLSPVISFVLGRRCWLGAGRVTVSQEAGACVCTRCVLGFSVTGPAEHQLLLQGIWNNSQLQVHCSHPPVSTQHSLLPCALTAVCISSYFHLLLCSPEIVLLRIFFCFTSKKGCSLRLGQSWEWTHGDVW